MSTISKHYAFPSVHYIKLASVHYIKSTTTHFLVSTISNFIVSITNIRHYAFSSVHYIKFPSVHYKYQTLRIFHSPLYQISQCPLHISNTTHFLQSTISNFLVFIAHIKHYTFPTVHYIKLYQTLSCQKCGHYTFPMQKCQNCVLIANVHHIK